MTGPEAIIEKQFVEYVESRGCLALKLRVDGRKGFPDRTIITPHGVMFIELKAQGGKPSRHQLNWQITLRNYGYVSEITNNLERAKRLLEDFLKEGKRHAK